MGIFERHRKPFVQILKLESIFFGKFRGKFNLFNRKINVFYQQIYLSAKFVLRKFFSSKFIFHHTLLLHFVKIYLLFEGNIQNFSIVSKPIQPKTTSINSILKFYFSCKAYRIFDIIRYFIHPGIYNRWNWRQTDYVSESIRNESVVEMIRPCISCTSNCTYQKGKYYVRHHET